MTMKEIKVVIDGKEVAGLEGMTILEAAEQAGIWIPTLCHSKELGPSGVCRLCVVEVEGSPRLVGSCHTPITQGMRIQTHSSQVVRTRRVLLELMMAGHTGACVNDDRLEECRLNQLASDFELGPPRFKPNQPRFYAVEAVSPYVRRDLSKCIMCRRCIIACREIAKKNVYATGYRGFQAKVIVGCDEALNTEDCRDCGICIDFCPTSALSRPEGFQGGAEKGAHSPSQSPEKTSQPDGREKLLELLKAEQQTSGVISDDFITRLSKQLKLSRSEIYGVTTFYAFLSTRPLGKHVIRVCRSLPCYLKHSLMLIEAIGQTLGIAPGETTEDGNFSLELTNCIGACDQAPALMINQELHGNLTADMIPKLLESYT